MSFIEENEIEKYIEKLIESLKLKEKDPKNHIDSQVLLKTFQTLANSFNSILENQTCEINFEAVYRLSYNMHMNGYGQYIYNLAKKLIYIYVLKFLDSLLNDNVSESLLITISNFWINFQKSTDMIHMSISFINYKDIRGKACESIPTFANDIFSTKILNSPIFSSRFQSSLISIIKSKQFNQKDINTLLIKLSELLFNVNKVKYKEIFEECTCEIVESDFHEYVNRLYETNDFLLTITMINNFMSQNNSHWYKYLHVSSYAIINQTIMRCLVKNHFILIKELQINNPKDLLIKNDFSGLRFMYFFFVCDKALFNLYISFFEKQMDDYIVYVNDVNKNEIFRIIPLYQYLKKIEDFVDICQYIFKFCFNRNPKIKLFLKRCPKIFIKNHPYFDHYVLLFIHKYLWDPKFHNDSPISHKLMKKIEFLLNLKNFDCRFLERYQEKLIHRLRFGFFSETREKAVVKIIEKKFGPVDMINIDRIFEDFKLSIKSNEEFFNFLTWNKVKNRSLTDLSSIVEEFSVNVQLFNQMIFKNQIKDHDNCKIPEEFEKVMKKFITYWIPKNNKKKLCFSLSNSTVEFAIQLFQNNKTITYNFCTPFHFYVIIREIMKHKEHTLDTIQKGTNLDIHSIKKYISILIDNVPDNQIIFKIPDNNEIKLTDKFIINTEYKSDKDMVVIQYAKKEIDEKSQKCMKTSKVDIDIVIKANILHLIKIQKEFRKNIIIDLVAKKLENLSPEKIKIESILDNMVAEQYLNFDPINEIYIFVD